MSNTEMPLRIVQSKQNPRLKELRKALTQPGRASDAGSLVGLEGPNLIHEALRAGLTIQTLFLADGSEKLLDQLTRAFPQILSVETLLLPRDLLNSALTTEAPQPIAALIEAPVWSWDSLAGNGPILILAGLQDPGNLGTILRSAEAFGATGILTLPGTVSPWNPKAVRASAGSIFRIPLLAASAINSIDHLREAGLRIFATTADAAEPAELVNLAGPVALLIGNEGNGIPRPLSAMADGALTIPCPGPVESLNAAVAASVLLYEASRQRTLRIGGPTSLRGDRR
jgi:TrmH family RNA methyltransferase